MIKQLILEEKLDYTKSQLKNLGWTIIGGRINDYINIVKNKGYKAAYDAIKKTYGKNVDIVYRGLLVCMKYGVYKYHDDERFL